MNRQRAAPLFVVLLLLPVFALAAQERDDHVKDGPYVNVYEDDHATFQFRRDRITQVDDELYRVWVRWLWAEPRPWKGRSEAALVLFIDLDCRRPAIRELAILHKDEDAAIYDAEEFEPGERPWRSFDPESGPAAALDRLCSFLPALLD